MSVASCRGKTALVTNASRAPGKAVAMALGEQGARVLIHDRERAANVEPLVEAIVAAGGIAKATAADTTSAEGTRQLARLVRAVIGDRLDILVIDVEAVDPATPFLLVELLLPILNTGSRVIALQPQRQSAGATAGGLKRLAGQLMARGVRMNVVPAYGPGATASIGSAVTSLATGRP